MEKGNEAATAPAQDPTATQTRPEAPPASSQPGSEPASSAAGEGSTTATAPGEAVSQPSTGTGTHRREVLHQGPREQTYPTGETLRLDGQGGAELVKGGRVARLQPGTAPDGGDDWIDPKTGQRAAGDLWATADHRLRQLEMDLGLRDTMQR